MTDTELRRQSLQISRLLNNNQAQRRSVMKGHKISLRPPTPAEADRVYEVCWNKILLLDCMISRGIRHQKLEIVEELCLERHIGVVGNGLLERFPAHGQRSGEVYYMNWLGGIMVEIYVAKVVLPQVLPELQRVHNIGADSINSPTMFRPTHKPDLAAYVSGGKEYWFEIQYGTGNNNMDVKAAKIKMAEKTVRKSGIETAVLFLDPVRGIGACVRDIGCLHDVEFQKRAMLDGKDVWPIPQSCIVWALDKKPPMFHTWPKAKAFV